MSNLIPYILKVNVYLLLFYFIYFLVLRKTTFHQLNRWYLLTGTGFSFFLPGVDFSRISFISQPQIQVVFDGFDDTFQQWQAIEQAVLAKSSSIISTETILFALYAIVGFSLVIRFARGIISISKLKYNSERKMQFDIPFFTGIKIKQPFTFLKWIFIPSENHNEESDVRILKHEKAHADQWHTLDLLLIEFIQIFLWFNPFVILIRHALKQVHEYLADAKVLEADKVKADYLRLLASDFQLHGLTGIASQFYYLTIKNRIKMIAKHKTKQIYRLAYLLIIPVVLATTFAFSNSPIQSDITAKKGDYIPDIKPLAEKDITRISSGWGIRKHPFTGEMKMHKGVDFVAKSGKPVIATADGKVIEITFKEEGKGHGRYVVISHGKTYSTVYTQLSEFKVQTGQIIKKGDVVGLVGSSGLSTGPHLHYEVWKNGEQVNPADYFKDNPDN